MLKRKAFCDVYCYDVYMKIFGWMKLEKTKRPLCIKCVTERNNCEHFDYQMSHHLTEMAFDFSSLINFLPTYCRIPIIWLIRKTAFMIRFDRGTSKFHRNSPLHINSNIQNSLNSKQRPYIFMFFMVHWVSF